MSRYIDADKIILNGIENKTIEIRAQELVEEGYTKVSLLFHDLQKVIDSQPTADVVEVVRCKDCKWRKKNRFCLEHMRYELKDDGYCHMAERKR